MEDLPPSPLGHLAGADFFNVEVLTVFGLVRYSVFFVIQLKTRTVEIVGITHDPCDTWMKQMARNLTDPVDGFLRGIRHLIVDRDWLFSEAFGSILKETRRARSRRALVVWVRLPNRASASSKNRIQSLASAWSKRACARAGAGGASDSRRHVDWPLPVVPIV